MGRAVVLNTASVASATGGTFSDALVANSGDNLSVANYNDDGGKGAKIVNMWAIDSAHAAEGEAIWTRPETVSDQVHGFRFNVAGLFPGGAGNVGSHNVLPGLETFPLFKSDTAAFTFTCTAADALVLSWQTLYDDLPGVSASMADWEWVKQHRVSSIGIACNAVASGTKGLYGTGRSFTADDNRLIANQWYAILGYSVQTPCCTIALQGTDWGGQKIGGPAGVLTLDSPTWFLEQSLLWGIPLIPCFNSLNAPGINVYVADDAASTSPKIDFNLYQLDGQPPVVF